MWISIKIALRNLLRQKKRNLLLGIGIAFGMSILVIALSFTNGMTDIILNHFVKNAIGHVGLSVKEYGEKTADIIRDESYFTNLIYENLTDIEVVMANYQQFTRAVGNGTSDMMALVAQSRFGTAENLKYWSTKLVEGNLADFTNKKVANPVMIYEQKAKTLHVKAGDTIKVRLRTIYGQSQTATLTVVAIIKGSNDMEAMASYISVDTMQQLAGYATYEAGSLIINLSNINDPSETRKFADKLHDALEPYPVIIDAKVRQGNTQARLISLQSNSNSLALMKKEVTFKSGTLDIRNGKGAVVSTDLAKKLGLSLGSSLQVNYTSKYAGEAPGWDLKVTGIADFPAALGENVVLINEYPLYKDLFDYWPELLKNHKLVERGSSLSQSLTKPYTLMPRTYTMKDYRKKQINMNLEKRKGAFLDVRSMEEIAEMINQIKNVLLIIAVVWVLILFVIILVGVVNTLHMSIKERTREIGTIRAIGMQKGMVRDIFIWESTFLSFFASLGGIVFALIVMFLMSLMQLKPEGMISMLLRDGHLYFLPPMGMVLFCMILIVGFTVLAAALPARKASKISAAEALRTFE